MATRELERLGVARRIGVAGSRRILYEANDDVEPIFDAQFTRVRQQITSLRRADALLPPGRAKSRLRKMTELHEFWLMESTGIIDRWSRRMEAR